jgi:hypothetical protein
VQQQQHHHRQCRRRRQQCVGTAAAASGSQHRLVLCRASSPFQEQDVSPPAGAGAGTEQQHQLSEEALAAADLAFAHPSGVTVCVFGVEHLEPQPHIGEATESWCGASAASPLPRRQPAVRIPPHSTHSRNACTHTHPQQVTGSWPIGLLQWWSRRQPRPSTARHPATPSPAGTRCKVGCASDSRCTVRHAPAGQAQST